MLGIEVVKLLVWCMCWLIDGVIVQEYLLCVVEELFYKEGV